MKELQWLMAMVSDPTDAGLQLQAAKCLAEFMRADKYVPPSPSVRLALYFDLSTLRFCSSAGWLTLRTDGSCRQTSAGSRYARGCWARGRATTVRAPTVCAS